ATSNLPLREGKASVYEGGIRVPFIAYWPGKIEPNSFCDLPIGVEDIFPTILSLVGQEQDLQAMQLDGQSILPLFDDPQNKAKQYTRDTFFWYKAGGGYSAKTGTISPEPGSCIRKGDYKLMYHDQGYLELYNIAEDFEEKNDLSDEMPEKTQELFTMLDGMIDEVIATKYQRRPNPLYDPELAEAINARPYRNLRNLPVQEVSEQERQAAQRRDWTVQEKAKKKSKK
ncbi:MAG: sulfatase/phosphatase domain-containing protein, partial [Coraliomargarita sp.]